MLHAHVSFFAAGIVTMLLANLIRTPEDVWAGRWIMAWTVLLLVHAVVIGLLWAMQQWNADAPDEALHMRPPREREGAPSFSWGLGDTTGTDPQEVDFRVSDGRRTGATAGPPQATPAPGWTAWNIADQEPEDPPPGERASWKEASAAAWLDRPRPASDDRRGPETKPDA
jgi:hypothetical protein